MPYDTPCPRKGSIPLGRGGRKKDQRAGTQRSSHKSSSPITEKRRSPNPQANGWLLASRMEAQCPLQSCSHSRAEL
jgi:hypothetical protein